MARRNDIITFGAQTSDISQGRAPDGSTNIVFMTVTTPRTTISTTPHPCWRRSAMS
ncbi:MAG: hypothetical protein WDM76_04285 [Limisphaerales bacterium]